MNQANLVPISGFWSSLTDKRDVFNASVKDSHRSVTEFSDWLVVTA